MRLYDPQVNLLQLNCLTSLKHVVGWVVCGVIDADGLFESCAVLVTASIEVV
jgi:hypothetical protein